MNSEIKQRIKEIKSGKIPKGYKKSKIGAIPEDWEESKLDKLGIFFKGKGISRYEMKKEGLPCVGYGDIYTKYKYMFSDVYNYVDEKTAEKSTKIEKNTLLFTSSGETAEEIGKCVCYEGEEPIYVGGDIILYVTDKVDSIFLAFQQNTDYSIIEKAKLAQGHSVVHIYEKDLSNLTVVYPKNYIEGERIGNILKKQNEQILLQKRYIERLINKKDIILNKQFEENNMRKRVKLGDVCNITTGKLDANAMELNGEYPFFTCSKENFFINNYAYDCEALLIAGNGDIGNIKYYKGKFNAYQRTYILSDFKVNIRYIMYFLEKNLSKKISQGIQRSSMPYIKKESLENIYIYYNDYAQMKKTVKILDNINELIEINLEKIELLKKQQKALQQLLLTGIIRV